MADTIICIDHVFYGVWMLLIDVMLCSDFCFFSRSICLKYSCDWNPYAHTLLYLLPDLLVIEFCLWFATNNIGFLCYLHLVLQHLKVVFNVHVVHLSK